MNIACDFSCCILSIVWKMSSSSSIVSFLPSTSFVFVVNGLNTADVV